MAVFTSLKLSLRIINIYLTKSQFKCKSLCRFIALKSSINRIKTIATLEPAMLVRPN